MTEAELEEIRRRHWPWTEDCGETQICSADRMLWPCDTGVALAEVERLREKHHIEMDGMRESNVAMLGEVERLRGGLRAILREHGPEIEPGRGDRCGICSPQDKHYPCVTVQEARAALEEGE